jgi:hypothetical protein
VRLQAHTANSWGAPSLDVGFTIPPAFPDFFPANPRIDLMALWPGETDRTFEWWRVGIAANSVPISIGELCLAQMRHLGIRNIRWGGTRHLARPAVVHRTDFGVKHVYEFGTTQRVLEIATDATTQTTRDIADWFRSAGTNAPFVVVPVAEENEALLVTFGEAFVTHTRQRLNVNPFERLILEEVARGLWP